MKQFYVEYLVCNLIFWSFSILELIEKQWFNLIVNVSCSNSYNLFFVFSLYLILSIIVFRLLNNGRYIYSFTVITAQHEDCK